MPLKIRILLFATTFIWLQVYSAPLTSACLHPQQRSVRTRNEGEGATRTHTFDCEYRSLDEGELIDDIKAACRGIINISSIIHGKLMGPASVVSDHNYIATCTNSRVCIKVSYATLPSNGNARTLVAEYSGLTLVCTTIRVKIRSLPEAVCRSTSCITC